MMIRKQDGTKPGRRKEQRTSDSTEHNGNHTKGNSTWTIWKSDSGKKMKRN
jgi:hypothetical protein